MNQPYSGGLPPPPDPSTGSHVTLALLAQAQAQAALASTLQQAWLAATPEVRQACATSILMQVSSMLSQDDALRYAVGKFLNDLIQTQEFLELITPEQRDSLVTALVEALGRFLSSNPNDWDVREAIKRGTAEYLQRSMPEVAIEISKHDAVQALAK